MARDKDYRNTIYCPVLDNVEKQKNALEKEIKSRKHYCYNELRAWITLAIAILAFFLSIISLALQYI